MSAIKNFNFQNFGSSYQLHIETAADLAAIPILDEPFWAATSAPIVELGCDPALHPMLDPDADGRVLSDDIRRVAKWLDARLADNAGITKAAPHLILDHLKVASAEAKQLHVAATRILRNLDMDGEDRITLSQVRDHKSFHAMSIHNGDGVIPPEGTDDPVMQEFLRHILDTTGGVADLSGKKGVNRANLDVFMKNAHALLDWQDRAKVSDPAHALFPLEAETAAAHKQLQALRGKIDEFFTFCDLERLNRTLERPTPNPPCKPEIVDDPVAIASYLAAAPLAKPDAEGVLQLDTELNPVVVKALRTFGETVLARLRPETGGTRLDAATWQAVKAAFGPYEAWQAAKSGGEVEKLGPDKLRAYVNGPLPARLYGLIDEDLRIGKELAAVRDLEYLIMLQIGFIRICNNFIAFPYLFDPDSRAAFEVGRLVIDGRIFNFNVKVQDVAAHSAVAARSGIYLLYSEVSGPGDADKFNICTPVTSHTLGQLGVGKRGVLFDLKGRERDVRVIKVVENPISLRNAVSKPFRRLGELLAGTMEKLTASTEKQLETNIAQTTTKVEGDVKTTMNVPLQEPATPAAKTAQESEAEKQGLRGMVFSGGIAFAALGSSMAYITKTLSTLNLQVILIALAVGLALILIPTILIADYKLNRRNLSGILEASGWAINTPMYMTRRMTKIFAPKPVRPSMIGTLKNDVTRKFLHQIDRRRRILGIPLPWFGAILVAVVVAWFAGKYWLRHRAEQAVLAPPPAGMVVVPAGSFIMGSDAPYAEPDESPERRVWLPAFYIDQYEVTNEKYQIVVPSWDYPPEDADKPVTGVTRQEAEAYAKAIGMRLPTAAEWEKAARGPNGNIYPWGNTFEDRRAHVSTENYGVNGKTRVGNYKERGVSYYGAQDMAGNVWEWVADDYQSSQLFGLEESIRRGIVKGGAYRYGPNSARSSYNGFEGINNTCNDVGFRCAKDADPAAEAPPAKKKKKTPAAGASSDDAAGDASGDGRGDASEGEGDASAPAEIAPAEAPAGE